MPFEKLFADSRRQLELWQNGPQSESNVNLTIPLLMQNKVPDGFEDGNLVKVDLRPESVSKCLLLCLSRCGKVLEMVKSPLFPPLLLFRAY